MTSTTFFIIFIPILAIILLAVNLILAPHNPYQEKDSVFECGFHSFLGQNRTQFSVSFFIFGLLFLLFDCDFRDQNPTLGQLLVLLGAKSGCVTFERRLGWGSLGHSWNIMWISISALEKLYKIYELPRRLIFKP